MKLRLFTTLFMLIALGFVFYSFLAFKPKNTEQVPTSTIPTVQKPDNEHIKKIARKISKRVAKNKGVMISFKDSLKINPKTFFEENKKAFGVGKDDEIRLTRKNDEIAEYQQYYKDFKVNGHGYRIGFDTNNFAVQASGSIIENLNLDVKPKLKEKAALQIAIDSINSFYKKQGKFDILKYCWEDERMINSRKEYNLSCKPTVELLISKNRFAPFEPENYTLFYVFNIMIASPERNTYTIYVNAKTGIIDLFKDAIVYGNYQGMVKNKH